METADDILEELSPQLPGQVPLQAESGAESGAESAAVNQSPRKLDPDHQKLLKCLAYEPMPIDELVDCSGFAASEVASMLLILELEGCVVSESGLFTRVG